MLIMNRTEPPAAGDLPVWIGVYGNERENRGCCAEGDLARGLRREWINQNYYS